MIDLLGANAEMSAMVAWLRNDPSIVAAVSEQIGYFRLGLQVDLVGRSPRRDMIRSVPTAKIGTRIRRASRLRPR